MILHDPIVHKIILKMQENVVRDTDPQTSKPCQLAECWHDTTDLADLLAETVRENDHARGCKNAQGTLSNSEIFQQVIHEDIKRIVDEMRRFRIDFYD